MRQSVSRFVGPSARLWTPTASNEVSINYFLESTSGAGGKADRTLRAVEGLRIFGQVADTNTHAEFTQDGRAFGVTGTTFWEVLASGVTMIRGTVAFVTGKPATIVSNGSAGNQLCICSGYNVYIFDLVTSVFTQVDVPTSGGEHILMVEFMDGYFFAQQYLSRRVYYSDLENGLSWPSLSYIERSWGSDDLSFIKRAERQLFLIGTKTGEVWADNGNPTSPFAPIQGTFVETGCCAPFSGTRDGDSLVWVNQDERGGASVVKASGYKPVKISSYPIDLLVEQDQLDLSGAVGFCHGSQGHLWYWLQLHTGAGVARTTPVLDLVEKEWAERAMWDVTTGVWTPHIARCHMYAFGKHLVGVLDSGFLYELTFDALADGVVL